MEFLDKLMTTCIFFNAFIGVLIFRHLKDLCKKTAENESRIRGLTDDIRHINMVTERTANAMANINTHKKDLMDVEAAVTKLQEEVNILKIPTPVISPLPKLKEKAEKPYVKVKY